MSRRLLIEADGGSRGNPGPAGYGAVVRDRDTSEVLAEVAAGIGVATNNVAEYRGLIAGLRAALDLDPSEVDVRMDSKLVVEQMSGRWKVKHEGIRPLAAEAAALVRQLPRVRFHHIPRERNRHADRLANEAMDAAARGREWKRRPVAEPGAADPGGSSAGGSSAGAASRGAASGGAASGGNRLAGWMAAPAPPTATLLLRHGETRWTAEKRFCGSTDLPLTERGQAQGAAVAERLAAGGIERLVGGRPGRIVSSPLVRARETAALVADRLGVPVTVEDALRETDFGAWEGATFAEAQEQWPSEVAAWLADPELAPPGGESFASTSRRVRAARDRLLSDYPGEPVLVVAHVTPIKQLLRFALDAPPVALYRMQLDPAGLSVVDFYADGPSVVRLVNDTSHLVT